MTHSAASHLFVLDEIVTKSSLPFNQIKGIERVIEPAKAMRANVSSNWRVFHFRGGA